MQATNLQAELKEKNSEIEAETVSLEDEVNEELDRLGQGGRWIWTLFIIATLPNILNGFHVSSYVFFGKMPDSFWCEVPALNSTSWTHEEMLHISTESHEPNSCGIINYDYELLSSMSYSDALNYTMTHNSLPTISCLSRPMDKIHYDLKGSSIVSEWDLVCENSVWRSFVQVIISLGKCIGGSLVGVMSDKYGRKRLFSTGCIIFTLASILAIYSPWYWSFLLARFILGLSTPAMYFPSMILMTENVAAHHRAWMGIAFSNAYSLGMIYLAAAAIFFPNWRELQLALTVPAVMLVAILYFYKESPRWLLSKGRIEQAYQVVFNRPVDKSRTNVDLKKNYAHPTHTNSKGVFFEIRGLYKTPTLRRAAIICHFGFFTATFTYYVTAINSVNLSANPVVYVSAMGLVDIVGLSSSILLLAYIGRKWGCFFYYTLAATSLLIMLLVPPEDKSLVVCIAMVGRLGASAAYGIIGLYTTELFPTEVRNSAIGVSSMFGHIGSMMAPFVVDFLGHIAWYIPTTICGVSLLVAALMILLNPETSQTKLIDHVGEKSDSSP